MKESDNYKLPKTAMGLYVKLFCKKNVTKENRQSNLIEAINSWVSLSKSDKKYFMNVFMEYKTKFKSCLASNLQNVELYMKKKQKLCKRKSKQLSINHNQDSYEGVEAISQITEIDKANCFPMHQNMYENIESDNQHDKEQLENNNTISIPIETVICGETNLAGAQRFISEPTPPIRLSRELFEIVKNNDETTRNINWAALTKLQKQRYQRAVLSIKNNYIKEYTAYLEQLPLQHLFKYYKSKFQ